MSRKAVLLDWDGTLVHSLPLKIDNAARLLSRRLRVSPEAVRASYRRHSGVPRHELFEQISLECRGRGLADDDFASLSRDFTEANLTAVGQKGALRANLRRTLKTLRARGCVVAVSSAAIQQELTTLSSAFGLSALFDELLGSRPGFSKGPEHVGYVCQRYGVPASAVTGVGDEARDMELFRLAGITPIGITGTSSKSQLISAGAERVIDDLAELVSHVC